MRPDLLIGCALAALVCMGCEGDGHRMRGSSGNPTGGQGGDEPTPPPAPTTARSDKAQLRFKRDVRLRNDFAAALKLFPSQMCRELGQYDCVADVHGVALGGLRPYDLGINDYASDTGVTAPLVVERIALSGCATRADIDLSDPAAATIYRGLPIVDGALSDTGDPAVANAIVTLYQRVLLRDPTDDERGHLVGLYDDIAAESGAPARDWAVLSCFAVLTTTESLFY